MGLDFQFGVLRGPSQITDIDGRGRRGLPSAFATGYGGKNVFDDDKDCFAWTDLMEKAHGRFGWRLHAWVLMGNHFHFLVETPEPNLVAGMKWVLGERSFGEKVLQAIKAPFAPDRKKGSVGGDAARAHDPRKRIGTTDER